MSTPAPRRFTRDTQHRMIGGVCAGLARELGISATLVRWAFVLSIVLPGPQVLAYLLLWLIMPPDSRY